MDKYMDKSAKQACLAEISHRICDADLKVSINDISSNWKVNLRDSEALLLDWCAEHSSTAVSKEFLIRGVDPQGHCVISVVPETRLDNVKRLFPQLCSSLFSVELPSSSERLGTHQLSNGVVINLPLDGKCRTPRTQVVPVADVKPSLTEVKKVEVAKSKPSMFGAKTSVVVKKSPPRSGKTPEKSVKVEAATPKKESPKKSSTKTPASKPSIASFFSKPSAAPKAAKPKEEPMEEDSEIHMSEEPEEKEASPVKPEPRKVTPPKSKNESRKRSVADTQDSDGEDNGIPATPQQSNKRVRKESNRDKSASKAKLSVKKITKQDQSSDEDIPASPEPKKENKKTASRFRRIVDSDSEEEPAAVVSKQPVEMDSTTKRRKAKRTVTRMYEDENGYMKSVKEIEEYTCSEDEESGDKPAETAAETKTAASENIPPKKNNAKSPPKTLAKKITPPKAANNKQGSILSFFSKK